jgi:hypothetical protein
MLMEIFMFGMVLLGQMQVRLLVLKDLQVPLDFRVLLVQQVQSVLQDHREFRDLQVLKVLKERLVLKD